VVSSRRCSRIAESTEYGLRVSMVTFLSMNFWISARSLADRRLKLGPSFGFSSGYLRTASICCVQEVTSGWNCAHMPSSSFVAS
jgi:hypothetical protein